MYWVGRASAGLGVEVGRGAVSDTAFVDSDSTTRVTILSGSDLSGRGSLSSYWSTSKESKEHLVPLSKALTPAAAFLCFCSHAYSLNLSSVASLIVFLKSKGVESLMDSSETLSSFFFPFFPYNQGPPYHQRLLLQYIFYDDLEGRIP